MIVYITCRQEGNRKLGGFKTCMFLFDMCTLYRHMMLKWSRAVSTTAVVKCILELVKQRSSVCTDCITSPDYSSGLWGYLVSHKTSSLVLDLIHVMKY